MQYPTLLFCLPCWSSTQLTIHAVVCPLATCHQPQSMLSLALAISPTYDKFLPEDRFESAEDRLLSDSDDTMLIDFSTFNPYKLFEGGTFFFQWLCQTQAVKEPIPIPPEKSQGGTFIGILIFQKWRQRYKEMRCLVQDHMHQESCRDGTSLVVQCLRLYPSNVGGVGSIPGQRTKIPYAPWHSKEKKERTL